MWPKVFEHSINYVLPSSLPAVYPTLKLTVFVSHKMDEVGIRSFPFWGPGLFSGASCYFQGRVKPASFLVSVVVSNIFYFHPYLGKWSNLTNMFQMGWSHQPVSCYLIFVISSYDLGLLAVGTGRGCKNSEEAKGILRLGNPDIHNSLPSKTVAVNFQQLYHQNQPQLPKKHGSIYTNN